MQLGKCLANSVACDEYSSRALCFSFGRSLLVLAHIIIKINNRIVFSNSELSGHMSVFFMPLKIIVS